MRDLTLIVAIIAIILLVFQAAPTERPSVSNTNWMGLGDGEMAAFVFSVIFAGLAVVMAASL